MEVSPIDLFTCLQSVPFPFSLGWTLRLISQGDIGHVLMQLPVSGSPKFSLKFTYIQPIFVCILKFQRMKWVKSIPSPVNSRTTFYPPFPISSPYLQSLPPFGCFSFYQLFPSSYDPSFSSFFIKTLKCILTSSFDLFIYIYIYPLQSSIHYYHLYLLIIILHWVAKSNGNLLSLKY